MTSGTSLLSPVTDNATLNSNNFRPSSPSPTSNDTSTPSDSLPSSPPLSSTDDVTTIFVVGFPDDMQEREFQNMFIFSKGFEAASLKWHCKDQQEEQDVFNIMSSMNSKKQMIGFAKFFTRQEAEEAANAMNGRKVDQEKSAILKAEMAKKNLHVKRNSIVPSTTSSTATSSTTSTLQSAVFLPEPTGSILSRRLSQPTSMQHQFPLPPAIADITFTTSQHAPAYESFSPLPSDLLSPEDYKNDQPFFSENTLTTPNTPSFGDSLFGFRSQSFDGRNDQIHPFQLFSKPVNKNSSESEADPFNYLSKSTPIPHHDFSYPPHSVFSNTDELMFMSRKNSLQPISVLERSTSISSVTNSSNRNASTADQNPPCNTLYVGNLPPATNEDELRSLFSSCEGYKRMCFRQKPQGPMCFVEFEGVVFAAHAMKEHQGHVLSNSAKGGVRLSFSKNPLFIKPSKDISNNMGFLFSFKQMGTALLADL